jgi:predicted ATPase
MAAYRAQVAVWQANSVKNPQAPIYFDRGVGDAFTCADLIGHTLPVDLRVQASACVYRDPVFLAPWWPEIYTTDTEEAERTEHAIVKTYTQLGYRIARLPLASAQERADFILQESAQL